MRRLGRVLREPEVQRRMGAAALSGVLLALAFPAFDIGALALVALVPLLWAWRDATPARAALYGFVFGVVFAGILLYWLWYFGIVAIVPLVAAWAAYTALTGYLVGCLNRAGLRSPWLIAAAWVVPEALRGRWPFGGLPWGDLGVALHDFPPARALASWGGVALVSFVLVVFNAYLVELAVALRVQGRRSIVVATAGVGAVVVLVAGADVARYQTHPSGELRVAMLQGNDQDRYLTTEEKRSGYLTEQHFALANQLRGPYDLIVFPESSLDDFSPESNPSLRSRLVAVGSRSTARTCSPTRPSRRPTDATSTRTCSTRRTGVSPARTPSSISSRSASTCRSGRWSIGPASSTAFRTTTRRGRSGRSSGQGPPAGDASSASSRRSRRSCATSSAAAPRSSW